MYLSNLLKVDLINMVKAKIEKLNPENEVYNLRLYVAGQTEKSMVAFANLKKIGEEFLKGRYKIEIVDLMKNPQLAEGDQILAVPTLVRKLPPPIRKIIGDLSNTERVLVGLDIQKKQQMQEGHGDQR